MLKINPFKVLMSKINSDETIKQNMKKGDFIYGSTAITAQIGPLNSRPPGDIDMISRQNNQRAASITQGLNRNASYPFYYTKKLKTLPVHSSESSYGYSYRDSSYGYTKSGNTVRVLTIGEDMRKGTDDDKTVADISRPYKPYRTVVVNGVRYADIRDMARDKRGTLKEPEKKFRHEKDKEDLRYINFSMKQKSIKNKI